MKLLLNLLFSVSIFLGFVYLLGELRPNMDAQIGRIATLIVGVMCGLYMFAYYDIQIQKIRKLEKSLTKKRSNE